LFLVITNIIIYLPLFYIQLHNKAIYDSLSTNKGIDSIIHYNMHAAITDQTIGLHFVKKYILLLTMLVLFNTFAAYNILVALILVDTQSSK